MSFEQLKREAVLLERQLEEKVSRYQQLAQKLHQAAVSHDLSTAWSEQGNMPSWDESTLLQQEIQRMLQALQDLISNRLAAAAITPSQIAVVGRYRDIVVDLRADLEKSQQTVRRASERRELLAGSAAAAPGANGQVDPAMEHLLRERNHIHNSLNAASSVLGQADSIRSDLRTQGRSLRNATSLLGALTSNVPGLNHLVEQIRRRRSKDDMIVAGVIASCIVFTLWYMFG